MLVVRAYAEYFHQLKNHQVKSKNTFGPHNDRGFQIIFPPSFWWSSTIHKNKSLQQLRSRRSPETTDFILNKTKKKHCLLYFPMTTCHHWENFDLGIHFLKLQTTTRVLQKGKNKKTLENERHEDCNLIFYFRLIFSLQTRVYYYDPSPLASSTDRRDY